MKSSAKVLIDFLTIRKYGPVEIIDFSLDQSFVMEYVRSASTIYEHNFPKEIKPFRLESI
jgi:hypothetical protein